MSQPEISLKKPDQKVWAGRILRSFIVFFSWLPLSLNRLLGAGIGYLLWVFPSANRRIAERNIGVAYPELSAKEQAARVKACLIEMGKMITELGPAWLWSSEKLLPLIKEVKGEAYLQAALARQKGVIFLAPHLGSWEIISPYLSTQYPTTFLYRPPNVPSIESFIVKTRGRFGATLAPTSMRGVRTLIKALKENQVTGILPDQDPGESGGIHAPFFNRPARTMTLVSKLIQKTDCAFVYIVLQRLPGAKGYVLHFLPADAALASKDELEAAIALNQGIEKCIAIAPEQYLWSYKRFRSPPEGVADIYKN